MGIKVKIIADSIGPNGRRITTFELRYHRFIHSELMTHRALSKNAASSRAIPIAKMLQRIKDEPALPLHWGQNQKGMQAGAELSGWRKRVAVLTWLAACRVACFLSWFLAWLGVHKQVANRITEPFQYMVTVVTATGWANFFHLRYHPAAQPEFQALARAMYQAYRDSVPCEVAAGEWHLPYIKADDWADALRLAAEQLRKEKLPELACGVFANHVDDRATEILLKVSAGRCARTSYVNQDGVRSLADDVALHDRLVKTADSGEPGHWSPLEHQAEAQWWDTRSGNFVGWTQYRKQFPNECTTVMPDIK